MDSSKCAASEVCNIESPYPEALWVDLKTALRVEELGSGKRTNRKLGLQVGEKGRVREPCPLFALQAQVRVKASVTQAHISGRC